MPQSPPLWDAFAICEGPRQDDRICCGLTKRGTPCKLYVTEDVHKAGVKKLNTLACLPFDLPNLLRNLDDIVPHFLCARWHRRLQVNDVRERWEEAAIRNQAQVSTPRPGGATEAPSREERALPSEVLLHEEPTRPCSPVSSGRPDLDPTQLTPTTELGGSSKVFSRRLTEAALRENRVPWSISVDDPALLSIERGSGGEVSLYLQSFRPTSSLRDKSCGICRGEDQDETVVLKCGRCTSYVHLGCMSVWLRARWSGNRASCIICRYERPFFAYYDTPTAEALWARRQESAAVTDNLDWSTTSHDNQQPLGSVAGPAEAPPSVAGASSPAARPSAHTAHQQPGAVEYPHLPTIRALPKLPLRRSERATKAPDRYVP